MGRGRTRSADLASPFRGVRTREVPRTHLQWCAAYFPRLRPGQFYCHLSAAVLWGMPLERAHESANLVHVGVIAPARPPQAVGVVGHVLPAGSAIQTRLRMPTLNPTDTWSYLGLVLDHTRLVVTGDFLVRRKLPLATLAQLEAAASVAGRPGIRAVRRALADVRMNTDSPKETELRLVIVAAGLPEPVVGHTVRDHKGDFVATPDLAYPGERIAIEYEGQQHFSDPSVYADDILRYELLEEAGWLVIRVIARDLSHDRRQLISRIKHALARRA